MNEVHQGLKAIRGSPLKCRTIELCICLQTTRIYSPCYLQWNSPFLLLPDRFSLASISSPPCRFSSYKLRKCSNITKGLPSPGWIEQDCKTESVWVEEGRIYPPVAVEILYPYANGSYNSILISVKHWEMNTDVDPNIVPLTLSTPPSQRCPILAESRWCSAWLGLSRAKCEQGSIGESNLNVSDISWSISFL